LVWLEYQYLNLFSILEYFKLEFGLVLISSYHELDIFTKGNIFVKGDISAYEYSKFVYENAVHFYIPTYNPERFSLHLRDGPQYNRSGKS
jgi:hypothetical protein